MGLEDSDVVMEPDDLHGRGVNLAARLMGIAGPGEIVVSAHVHDQLTPDLDAEAEDLGDCYLRHVSQPVRAYRIGPPGPRPAFRPAALQDELAPFVAILPFAARLTSPEHEVIGEILAEEIIRSLSVTSDLNVISRLSTSTFRGRQVSLDEIRTHLNADYVLSGVFSSDGSGLTLSAELAETKSGRILWTDRAKARVSDVVSGEPQLTARIAAEVNTAIVSGELRHAQTQSLPTLKSYTLMLGAIALMHRLSIDDFHYARELLQTLIERGSRHPIPLAWMANWHVLRVQQGWSNDEKAEAMRALDCTKRALDSDPSCSLALAVDGFVHTNLMKRFDVAEERYDEALASNPNNALAWLLRGTLFTFKDDGARAINDTRHALQLAPLGPHRWFYDTLAAGACVTAREYDRALALSLRSMKANRKHPSTLRILTVAQWQLGLHGDARRTARELLSIQPDLTVGRWRAGSPGGATKTGKEIAEVLKLVGVPE
jgi:TolB-like protein